MLSINLPEQLFWDININTFDENKNKRLIIERVFTLGDIAHVKELIKYYGIEIIKQEIVNVGFLDKKTLSWLSLFLEIPKNKFKCYTKIQSNQIHWNY
ncbi:MAG: hypothetical protein L3J35_12520 [Bacteroidales bacterium]|nr:hypothetical protein [Bacteroidales bacterium]